MLPSSICLVLYGDVPSVLLDEVRMMTQNLRIAGQLMGSSSSLQVHTDQIYARATMSDRSGSVYHPSSHISPMLSSHIVLLANCSWYDCWSKAQAAYGEIGRSF